MDLRGRAAVRKIWTLLVQDLEPEHSVLDFLHEKGEESGILLEEYRAILSCPTREARAQALLMQVMTTCPVQLFLQALRWEDAHGHLAEALQRSLLSDPPHDAAMDGTVVVKKKISPAFPPTALHGILWADLQEGLVLAVKSAIESSSGGCRGLKRRVEEEDQENVAPLPRPPSRSPAKRVGRGPAPSLLKHMCRVLHGQWTFDKREGDMIDMKISFNPNVRTNPDVRFLACFFDVHFKRVSPVSRGLDGMKEYLPNTSDHALSLLMYLTAKGRVAIEEDRLQEAKGILEAAEASVQLLEPSLETLYFLRVFSILKQKFLYLSDGGTSREEYNLVLARAGDVADEFSFSEENKGLLSVVHWHRARAYLHFDPDQEPPYVGDFGRARPELLWQVPAAARSASPEVNPRIAALEVNPRIAALEGKPPIAAPEIRSCHAAHQVGQGSSADSKLLISETVEGSAAGFKSAIPDSEREIAASLRNLRMDCGANDVALPWPARGYDPSMPDQHSAPSVHVEGSSVQSSRAGHGGGSLATSAAALAAATSAASHALRQVEEGLGALGDDAEQKGCHCLVRAALAGRLGRVEEARAWLAKVATAAYSSPLTLARARRLRRHLSPESPAECQSEQVNKIVAHLKVETNKTR